MRKLLAGFVFLLAGVATQASAADDVVLSPAGYDWSGVYVGATVGYAFGTQIHCDFGTPQCPPPGDEFPEIPIDGIMGGVTVGYNHQLSNNIVVGVEGDFNIGDNRGTSGDTDDFGCGTDECISELEWYATARVRAGYAINNILPFATAGIAVSRVFGAVDQPDDPTAAGSATLVSFVAGGGVEVGLTQDVSVKLDGMYIFNNQTNDYDQVGNCGTPGCYTDNNDFGVVRLGLNYRF